MAKKNVIEDGLKKHRGRPARKKGPVEQARTATREEAQEARKALHALAEKVKSAQVRAAGSAYIAIIDAAACAWAGFQAQQAIQKADDIAAGKPYKPTKEDKAAKEDAESEAEAEADNAG